MYFILICMYTKPCHFLASGAGKWSVPQLEVILNSRIPYFIGNKIQNHILQFLSFASLFRVFIPVPDVYSCPSVPWHVLTLHFTPLPIPRGAGFAAPLSFPVLLDPALPPSLPEGDSKFKEPQGWHQKNSKQAWNSAPIRFLTWQWQSQQHCPRKAGEGRRQVQGNFSPQSWKRNYFTLR